MSFKSLKAEVQRLAQQIGDDRAAIRSPGILTSTTPRGIRRKPKPQTQPTRGSTSITPRWG